MEDRWSRRDWLFWVALSVPLLLLVVLVWPRTQGGDVAFLVSAAAYLVLRRPWRGPRDRSERR